MPALILALLTALGEGASDPEWYVSVYGGKAWHSGDDLRLERAGSATDLTYHDVTWEDRSFRSPFYYGLRAGWFPSRESRWGLAIDFIHAKLHLEEDDFARVSGSRAGIPVDAIERVGDTIASFSVSHGFNFALVNALYRWPGGGVEPYVGGGVGVVIAHVEAEIGGDREEGYQAAWPAYEAFAGARIRLAEAWSAFVESKMSYARLELDVPRGTVELSPMTLHVVFGVTYAF